MATSPSPSSPAARPGRRTRGLSPRALASPRHPATRWRDPITFAGQSEPAVRRTVTPQIHSDDRLRINAFDWDGPDGFPDTMQAGGFDAVIGNPPYSYMISAPEQAYFARCYRHQDYQKDLYLLFLERYRRFLAPDGMLGVIVSNTWLQSVTLRSVRQHLTRSYRWRRILLLPDKVFAATVDTHVIIFQNAVQSSETSGELTVDVRVGNAIRPSHRLPWSLIPTTGDAINVSASVEQQALMKRIRNRSKPLLEVCDVYNGIKPFEKGKGQPPQTALIVQKRPFVREGKRPDHTWSPLLRGGLIRRFRILWDHNYWMKYGPWLAAPRDPSIFEAPLKIMVRQTGDSLVATLVRQGFYARNNMHVLLPRTPGCNLKYVLGLINSKLMGFAYTVMNPEKGEALAEVKKAHVEQLPVRVIDPSIETEQATHDRIVALVDRMLALPSQRAAAKTPHEQTALDRQIAATDAQIDREVYALYGLTAEEIKLMESDAGCADSSRLGET